MDQFPPVFDFSAPDNQPPPPPTSQQPFDGFQDISHSLHPSQPPPSQPSPTSLPRNAAEERLALWRAIYSLGNNFDNHIQHQRQESAAHVQTLQSIADHLAAIAEARSAKTGVAKFKVPRIFDGKKEHIEGFLRDIGNALRFQRNIIVEDQDKVVYLSDFLADGAPSSWYRSLELNKPHVLEDYDVFIAEFRERFEESDQYAASLRRMKKLRQTHSASAYTSAFIEIASELDWTDQTKIQEYYDRLKEEVKDVLLHRKGRYFTTNFEVFTKEIISIDNELYSRKQDQKGSKQNNYTSTSSAPPFSPQYHHPTPTYAPPSASSVSTDVVPMEVDAIRRGPLTAEEKERRRANGLCLYCGQGKHLAATCPNKSERAKANDKKASPSSGKA